MGFALRDYQEDSINKARELFRQGHKKVLIVQPTGTGKGFQQSYIADSAKNCMTVLRRRDLIFQTRKNYKKYHDIESDMLIGGINNINGSKSLVASIDTLRNRIKKESYNSLKDFNFCQIDEAHDAVSNTYKDLFEFMGDKFYLGWTATPYKVSGKVHDFWDKCIISLTPQEAYDRGYISGCKIYSPFVIDTGEVKVRNGEFVESELLKAVSKSSVIGDVVSYYKRVANGRPAMCFCVNVEHSMLMASNFNNAGIKAMHLDASHSKAERDSANAKLKSGEIDVICNVNLFTTGFDAPYLEFLIDCAPTMSEVRYIQKWGRVLRPYKVCGKCGNEYGGDIACFACGSAIVRYEKQYATIIDHAANYSRHGHPIEKDRLPELSEKDSMIKEQLPKEVTKTCPKCFYSMDQGVMSCPDCGYDFRANLKARGVKEVDGELFEVNPEFEKQQLINKMKIKYYQLDTVWKVRRLKNREGIYKQMFAEFGDDLELIANIINLHPNYFGYLKRNRAAIEALDKQKMIENMNYKSEKIA